MFQRSYFSEPSSAFEHLPPDLHDPGVAEQRHGYSRVKETAEQLYRWSLGLIYLKFVIQSPDKAGAGVPDAHDR